MKRHKLGLAPGSSLAVLSAPDGFAIEIPHGCTLDDDKGRASIVLAFVDQQKGIERIRLHALARAAEGAALWFAYPKGGKLGTDVNRDILARALSAKGLEPVSIVALDDVWSALRVRHDPALKASRAARGSSLKAPTAKKAPSKKSAAKKNARTSTKR
jgi:hypothetical protein